jgi:hypothetical protein
MPKIFKDNKIATIVGVLVIASMMFSFSSYFFYSKQDGLILEQKVKSNKEATDLHAQQSIPQFKSIDDKLTKIIDWQIEQGKK